MITFLFIAGLILLILGAEALVRGASRIAAALHISPLVIGLTVVAYGTGSPELAVSIKAAVSGQSDIAVGNIIGSNILNILLVLGLSAIFIPLSVSHKLVRIDIPLLILVSVFVLILALDGTFTRLNGIILFTALIIYTLFLVYSGREEDKTVREDKSENVSEGNAKNWIRDTGLIIAGFILLVIGAEWLVDGAVFFALRLGVSELIIGLTIISIGTSLPELVTSVIAGIHKEQNIAVGNIVGSCLFNLMGVLGLSSMIAPGGLLISSAVIWFDMPVMIATAFACLPIFFTGGVISRWEAALFLGYYVIYTLYLILAAAHHDALTLYSATMLYFVVPLTAVTLFILALQEVRKRRKRRESPPS